MSLFYAGDVGAFIRHAEIGETRKTKYEIHKNSSEPFIYVGYTGKKLGYMCAKVRLLCGIDLNIPIQFHEEDSEIQFDLRADFFEDAFLFVFTVVETDGTGYEITVDLV